MTMRSLSFVSALLLSAAVIGSILVTPPSGLASESCSGMTWLVKLDAFGNPQWQKLVGCFGVASGGFAYGVSLQRTADGGYVIGGQGIASSTPSAPN
jgi:hypothetical protein